MFSQWLKNNTQPGQTIDLNHLIPTALNQSISGIKAHGTTYYIDDQDFSHHTYTFYYDGNSTTFLTFTDCNFLNTTIQNSFLRNVIFESHDDRFAFTAPDYFAFHNTTLIDSTLSGPGFLPPIVIHDSIFSRTTISDLDSTQVTAHHSTFSQIGLWPRFNSYTTNKPEPITLKLFNSKVSNSTLGCSGVLYARISTTPCANIFAENNSTFRDTEIAKSTLQLRDTVLHNATILSSDFKGSDLHLQNSTLSWSLYQYENGGWVIDNSILVNVNFEAPNLVCPLQISNSNYTNGVVNHVELTIVDGVTRDIDFKPYSFKAHNLSDTNSKITTWFFSANNCTFERTTFTPYGDKSKDFKNTILAGVHFSVGAWLADGTIKLENSSLTNSSTENWGIDATR
jgi:hypothetical protein